MFVTDTVNHTYVVAVVITGGRLMIGNSAVISHSPVPLSSAARPHNLIYWDIGEPLLLWVGYSLLGPLSMSSHKKLRLSLSQGAWSHITNLPRAISWPQICDPRQWMKLWPKKAKVTSCKFCPKLFQRTFLYVSLRLHPSWKLSQGAASPLKAISCFA